MQQQLERAKYRHWHVDVPAGRALGVLVVKSTPGAIAGAEVRALAPLGSGAFVVEWNMRCNNNFPDDAINIGDVIVCANWATNPDGIWEVLKAPDEHRLLILARRAEASAIASTFAEGRALPGPPWSPAVSQVSRPRDIGIAQVAQALRASAALREARGISRPGPPPALPLPARLPGPPPGPPLQRPAAPEASSDASPVSRYGLPPAGPPPALPQAPRAPSGPSVPAGVSIRSLSYWCASSGRLLTLPTPPQAAPSLELRAEAPLFVPGQLWPPGSRRSDPDSSWE